MNMIAGSPRTLTRLKKIPLHWRDGRGPSPFLNTIAFEALDLRQRLLRTGDAVPNRALLQIFREPLVAGPARPPDYSVSDPEADEAAGCIPVDNVRVEYPHVGADEIEQDEKGRHPDQAARDREPDSRPHAPRPELRELFLDREHRRVVID